MTTPAPTPTRIGPTTFTWGDRTYVMGILNVTPDSFSGDGLITGGDPLRAALDQAKRMVDDGADLLDIGGESTRPGHAPVDAAEEIGRVIPIVAAVHDALPDVPLSIDTTKAVVAEAALAAGATLLNDVWGVGPDPAMAELAASARVPLIVMHNRDEARYDDVVREVIDDLRRALDRAEQAGDPSRGPDRGSRYRIRKDRRPQRDAAAPSRCADRPRPADPARDVAQVDDRAHPRPAG